MKTTVKQLATGTFIVILILVGNIKAEATKVSRHVKTETALQMENWMTDEILWNTFSIDLAEFARETEAKPELEDWMIDDGLWNCINNIAEEAETCLELENWMTDLETWDVFNMENDPELKVEQWMINENFWNRY